MTLVPLTVACLTYVAGLYQLPVDLLDGLRRAEGGQVGAVTANKAQDGHITSWDIGPFQINDATWLKSVTVAWRQPSERTTFALLRDNGCANALAAAAIYRVYLTEAGGNYGVAVGYYNSHTPPQADRYRRHFILALRRLRAERGGHAP
jgi:hypothetical protein